MSYGYLVYDSAGRVITDSRVDMNLRRYPPITILLDPGAFTDITIVGVTSAADLAANWLFAETAASLEYFNTYASGSVQTTRTFVSTNVVRCTDVRDPATETGAFTYLIQPYFVNKG